MPQPLTDQQWNQVEAFLFAGRKIQAIKLFRELTGSDLLAAKTALEKHEQELRTQFPEKFKKSAGCSAAALLLVVCGVAFGALLTRMTV